MRNFTVFASLHCYYSCFPSLQHKKTLCLALTQTNFDYSVASWYPAIPKLAKERLQIVQNKLIRFMLNLGPRDHVGKEQLTTLGLLSADGKAKQIRLHNAHKVYNEKAVEERKGKVSWIARGKGIEG